MNSKKTNEITNHCIVVSKSKRPRYELRIGEINIKEIQTFKEFGNVLTKEWKCDTESWARIGITKVAFQKPSKVHRKMNLFLETKSSVLLCNITLLYLNNLLKGEEKTGSNKNTVLQKDTENPMYGTDKQRWSFKENGNKNTLVLRIRNGQLKYLGHVIW